MKFRGISLIYKRVWGLDGLIRGKVLNPKVFQTGDNAALFYAAGQ
jgi:hypothetical protein